MRKLNEESYSAVIKTSDCKVLLLKNVKQMYGSSALKWGQKRTNQLFFSRFENHKLRRESSWSQDRRTDRRHLSLMPWPTSPFRHGLGNLPRSFTPFLPHSQALSRTPHSLFPTVPPKGRTPSAAQPTPTTVCDPAAGQHSTICE